MRQKIKCGDFIKEYVPEPVIDHMLNEENFWENREHFFEEATIDDKNKAIDLTKFYIFLKSRDDTKLEKPIPHIKSW